MAIEKPNIILTDTKKSVGFKSKSGGSDKKPMVNRPSRLDHGKYLQQQFTNALKKQQDLINDQVTTIKYKKGIHLEFIGHQGFEFNTAGLESLRKDIRLANIHTDQSDDGKTTTRATIFIPDEAQTYFIEKINEYKYENTEKGRPKHNKLFNNLEHIELALFNAFWFGEKEEDIPKKHSKWCELWVQIPYKDNLHEVEPSLENVCKQIGIDIGEGEIRFPERSVRLIKTNVEQFLALLAGYRYVAELRPVPVLSSFFYSLGSSEQKKWVDDLLNRTRYRPSNTSVCILDTGVNTAHPLLKNVFDNNSVHTVNSQWGTHDHHHHGTEMAGIALYYNLEDRLALSNPIIIQHQLESVKILPPEGNNNPQLYGYITKQAISLAEIGHPKRNRVIAMAVTADQGNGLPSSWSGALDNLASGVDDGIKRLIIVSAGTVFPDEHKNSPYTKANELHAIEDPAQAWNVLTVGAYNEHIYFDEDFYQGYHPVAEPKQLSPYSSTSYTWDTKWPIKPDIVLSGGNILTDGINYTAEASLSLLTTSRNPLVNLFSTIDGTSSATAQAAWLSAQLMAEYPDLWPETIRALLVHSARWTSQMEEQFNEDNKKKSGRKKLLKFCGYGIPSLERAIQCKENSVNLIIQEEIKPFKKDAMDQMHFHTIPWPKDVLRNLGDTEAEIRITLSYFVEPGPDQVGWKDKYRYPSAQLRFDLINQDESRIDFERRVNRAIEENYEKGTREGSSGSDQWFVGIDGRSTGSIHSDFKTISAVDLCET